MIGRAPCGECGFENAHIKIKTDKEKAFPYRHCPECGAQYFTRNQRQADDLTGKIKPAKLDAPAGQVASMREVMEQKPAPEPAPAAPVPKGYKVVLGVRVPL